MKIITVRCVAGLCLLAISATAAGAPYNFEPKPASAVTVSWQKEFAKSLPAEDGRDAEFAERGFIATVDDPLTRTADGRVIWDVDKYHWVKGEAPDTVNPSLWRHVKLLSKHGLFEVSEGIWQVRGLDASNMTVIRGNSGWIIVDPLYTVETARNALALVNRHLGKRPVSAVIYTHSHGDHFGGVRGVVDDGDTPLIIAPAMFVEEIISEFLFNGNATGRRASYQFGTSLKPGPQGIVSGGIVIDAAPGSVSLIAPNDYIQQTGESRIVDGVPIEFQMVPESEAPAEMNLYLPKQRTLFISEIVSCTMHNVQTPRGAKARDALRWAGYLTEALALYGDRSDTLATGHCWPRFGNEAVVSHLSLQRDNYKFIHDQTVRMLNRGDTATEIADHLRPPAAVANEWSNRGYYGALQHNIKGVYQYYIGWWNGNPAQLDSLPPQALGERYVEAMGGATRVIAVARQAMETGDYRWSSELLSRLIFAEPDNEEGRALLADSFEQLAYQAESAIFRNYYLSGAAELRGNPPSRFPQSFPDMVRVIEPASLLDLVGTRINPDKLAGVQMTIAVTITDSNEEVLSTLNNSVLVNEIGQSLADPDIRLKGSKAMLMGLLVAKQPLSDIEKMGLVVTGDKEKLQKLLAAIEIPPSDFPVVLP